MDAQPQPLLVLQTSSQLPVDEVVVFRGEGNEGVVVEVLLPLLLAAPLQTEARGVVEVAQLPAKAVGQRHRHQHHHHHAAGCGPHEHPHETAALAIQLGDGRHDVFHVLERAVGLQAEVVACGAEVNLGLLHPEEKVDVAADAVDGVEDHEDGDVVSVGQGVEVVPDERRQGVQAVLGQVEVPEAGHVGEVGVERPDTVDTEIEVLQVVQVGQGRVMHLIHYYYMITLCT